MESINKEKITSLLSERSTDGIQKTFEVIKKVNLKDVRELTLLLLKSHALQADIFEKNFLNFSFRNMKSNFYTL